MCQEKRGILCSCWCELAICPSVAARLACLVVASIGKIYNVPLVLLFLRENLPPFSQKYSASVWAAIKETGGMDIGHIDNSIEDLVVNSFIVSRL